ncbi:PKD domain-containing protein [Saccharospirillum salsuginis]|uniref:PASTA domain-containing protein n=1 Tax=Saccharospirillum salsuginis TaxID=418750 RepID=A0A918KR86_9GAMM|nr:PKD domain-containing protein [Saccharospirillum salsuginis]GGX73718.1 hypothetical protein GCM10007392_46500 [Saccharospirillum salsuginis]
MVNKINSSVALACLAVTPGMGLAQSSSLGKEFTLAFPSNHGESGTPVLYMSSESDTAVTISVPGLAINETVQLSAGAVTSYMLPQALNRHGNALVKDLAVYIESAEDIAVYGLNAKRYTTDGFLALPQKVIGHEYYVLSYYGLNRYNWNLASEFVIVATEDDTRVIVTPSANINDTFQAQQPTELSLDKNQTIQLATADADLSGSHIVSNQPIVVYGAHECGDVPSRDPRIGWCDHLVETMVPVDKWGFNYDIVPLATRLSGDILRVMASQNNTEVVVNNEVVATLAAGEIFESELDGATSVRSAQPIYVAQYAMGQGADGVKADPFMMSIVPHEQFLDSYLFTTPEDGFADNFVNVVIEPGTNLSLDNETLDTSNFTPIPGSSLLGGQVTLEPGQHNLTADKPFGAYIYGFNAYDSYGYPAGQAFSDITPVSDPFLPNIGEFKHVGHTFVGTATDNEDLNANGILDPGEDLNSNGIIDGRSEDTNNNGEMDAGEDVNANGVLDRDFGLVVVELGDSENLSLHRTQSTGGRFPLFGFNISLIDPSIPGQGTLIVRDVHGNTREQPISVPVESALVDVELISRVSGDRLFIDNSSFSHDPESVITTNEGVEVTWRFDRLLSNEIRDLQYDVKLIGASENEQRLITRSLELSYVNTPGGDRHQVLLGPQHVNVTSSAFDLDLGVSNETTGPNTDVVVTASVKNLSGSTFSTELELEITDSNGHQLADTTIPLDSIEPGATVNPSWAWNTGNQYAGTYNVIARLRREGNLVNETTYQFQVVRDEQYDYPLEVDIATGSDAGNGQIINQDEFSTTDLLPVSVNLENVTSNELFNGGRVVIQVNNENGNEVQNWESDITAVQPGMASTIGKQFQLDDIPPGTYTVWTYVYDDDDDLVGVNSRIIEIVSNSNVDIQGNVQAEHEEILRGDDQTCIDTLENTGSSTYPAAQIEQSILDVTHNSIIESRQLTLQIDAQESLTEAWNGSTAGIDQGDYACVLRLVDNGESSTLGIDLFKVFNVVAEPGDSRSLFVGDTLTLDASTSREADGQPLTYEWTLVEKPSNSEIEIADPTAAAQEFIVDQQGDYVFELIASNGDDASLPKRVAISVPNRDPVADSGPDQAIQLQQLIQLDGLNSYDQDGDLLSYEWQFTQQPDGSLASFDDPSAGNPSFTVDAEGTYIAELTVRDDAGGSDTDQVILSASNVPPVADAGQDLLAHINDRVTLDGSGSFDVNGDELQYYWNLVEKPAGSQSDIVNSGSARPYVDIDVQGTYVAELIVHDGQLQSESDSITIFVGNSVPNADAGPDTRIDYGQYVYLDGSNSSDLDGDALNYNWNILSTPNGYKPYLYNRYSSQPYFYVNQTGEFVVQLIVSDGTNSSEPDLVVLSTENVKPYASAYRSGFGQVYLGDTIYLNGYGSDPDGDSLQFEWSFSDRPDNSQAQLISNEPESASFTIDEPGDYVVQLVTNDGELSSSPDSVYIYSAQACVANLDIRPKSRKIQLTWDYDPETYLVDIYRSTQFDGPYNWIAQTENTYSVWIDESVTDGTQYYYRIERHFTPDDDDCYGDYGDYGEYGEFSEFPSFGECDDGGYGEIPSLSDWSEETSFYDGYGDYGGYGNYFQSCESQVISSIPNRRVRYNLVPDVRGFSVEDAEQLLTSDGFSVGEILAVRTSAAEEGTVLNQDAPRNSRLPRGYGITLYVATWSND